MGACSCVAEGAFCAVGVLRGSRRAGIPRLAPEGRLFLADIGRLARELERVAEVPCVLTGDVVMVIAGFRAQTHFDGLATGVQVGAGLTIGATADFTNALTYSANRLADGIDAEVIVFTERAVGVACRTRWKWISTVFLALTEKWVLPIGNAGLPFSAEAIVHEGLACFNALTDVEGVGSLLQRDSPKIAKLILALASLDAVVAARRRLAGAVA